MKNQKHFFQGIILIIVLCCQDIGLYAQEEGKVLFNSDWQFKLGDSGLEEAKEVGPTKWRDLDLPHDWSVEGPFDKKWASGTGYLPGGVGWYKKSFSINHYNPKKKYAIYFDGIYKNSEVWINGKYLGKRPNGFIPIQYDLTPYLRAKGNQIYVKVDHSDYADSRYYTGSGIYRNVYMITQSSNHISKWGVFFKTPKITKKSAYAEVEVTVENHEKNANEVVLIATVADLEGTTVAQSQKTIHNNPNEKNLALLNLEIKNPKLWSPKSPNLYILTVKLQTNGKTIDRWEEKVGIRNFKFDPDHGFFLNGKNMLLKGVCIHHDAGTLGAAVPKEVWAERLKTLKELGSNAIRMSHYPHQDYIYELCDEMGFLVQDEAFDEWELGKNKWIEGWNVGKPGKDGYHISFEKWGKKDIADMILRNRNRPSIIMWSIGNEIDYPNDPYTHPILDEGNNPQIYGKGYQKDNPPVGRLGEIAKDLVKTAKEYDPTRPITAALAGVTMSNHSDYPSTLDIVGYNYQERRYEEDHKNYPNRVIYGSENGDSLEAWLAVKNNDYIASQFIWTAFDFLGEARAWPARSSGAGIIDLAGKPKPSFYFRKSLWNDEPMVYIGTKSIKKSGKSYNPLSSSWIGEKGELKSVVCYTNTDKVELFLNGKSLGKQNGSYEENKSITWKVPYEPGKLIIKGYNGEDIVAEHQLLTPGSLSDWIVVTDKKTLTGYGKEVIFLDITLTDRNGIEIMDNDQIIYVKVKGPAKLIGLESGNLSDTENYKLDYKKTYLGKLRGYIQSTGDKGNIKIKVKSENLPDKELTIAAIKPSK